MPTHRRLRKPLSGFLQTISSQRGRVLELSVKGRSIMTGIVPRTPECPWSTRLRGQNHEPAFKPLGYPGFGYSLFSRTCLSLPFFTFLNQVILAGPFARVLILEAGLSLGA